MSSHEYLVLSPHYYSVLEITVSHRTLSDQILNISSQFHIMIGHHVRTFRPHILTSSFEVTVHPKNLVRYIVKGHGTATDTSYSQMAALLGRASGQTQK